MSVSDMGGAGAPLDAFISPVESWNRLLCYVEAMIHSVSEPRTPPSLAFHNAPRSERERTSCYTGPAHPPSEILS